MAERRGLAGRPARNLGPRRRRLGRAVAAGVAACWLLLLAMTGSLAIATAVLILLAVLGIAAVLGLRAVGVGVRHPWPAEDRRPDFPGPSLPARGASGDDPDSYPEFVAHDGRTCPVPQQAPTVSSAADVTMLERAHPPVPVLRLVTAGSVTETSRPAAMAGRGAVDLRLPPEPTVSREHARFRFADGRWWVANLGRNGLTVNGGRVAGELPVADGDVIRWGTRPDAMLSRVEIG